MKIMGIDPGLKGGVAFYDGTELRVFATPVVSESFVKNGKKSQRNLMDLNMLVTLIREHEPDEAFLEKVAARSGQGVTSMFRFGTNYGEFRGVLAAFKLTWHEVTPQEWKRAYGLTSEKDGSLETARGLFPDNGLDFKLKKHDGLAEAALIAKFGFDKLNSLS